MSSVINIDKSKESTPEIPFQGNTSACKEVHDLGGIVFTMDCLGICVGVEGVCDRSVNVEGVDLSTMEATILSWKGIMFISDGVDMEVWGMIGCGVKGFNDTGVHCFLGIKGSGLLKGVDGLGIDTFYFLLGVWVQSLKESQSKVSNVSESGKGSMGVEGGDVLLGSSGLGQGSEGGYSSSNGVKGKELLLKGFFGLQPGLGETVIGIPLDCPDSSEACLTEG
ncbi:hypothetical protein K474DRAFT_1734746 [Panus rudis PR-1116 ss-1]|nr:hypothetical protein K474DRAFT_1734746 [Panus rudis PR-1116 ss-1]